MSKSVREVRRAAFEKWWVECENRKKPETFNNGDYCAPSVYNAWKAFNAALDAVEIKLPPEVAQFADDDRGRRAFSLFTNTAIRSCRAAIEQTGLGIRVK